MKEDGKIPGSFIFPLPDVIKEFQLESFAFQQKYGFRLPDKLGSDLIITCRYTIIKTVAHYPAICLTIAQM